METNVVGSGLHIHMQQSINLQHTLFCGQVFRWRQLGEDAFFGVAGTQAVHLRQLQQGFAITPCTPQQFESFWRRYFDLDFDYAACCTALGAD